MTPEREKLIRKTWEGVQGWPARGPVLNVAIRFPASYRPYRPKDPPDLPARNYLRFTQGIEYSEDGLWERRFVECEGVRVAEQTDETRWARGR